MKRSGPGPDDGRRVTLDRIPRKSRVRVLELAGGEAVLRQLSRPEIRAGVTLVFGILRKELSLVMLGQALGTTDVARVLSTTQILVFTLFITFYTPCVATVAAIMKETGRKLTALALAYTFVLATLLGVLARFLLGPVLAR
jgi:Fe2+ transport system protein B